MALTLQKEMARTNVNSLDVPIRMAKCSGPTDAARQQAITLVETAMRSADLTQNQLAVIAGVSESDITRAFSGERRFDLAWVICWSEHRGFAEAFWPAAARAMKVSVSERRRASIRRVVDAIQQLVLMLDEVA